MGAAAGRIFLSYRREDTKHLAGRLADRLDLRFGPGTVFMDVDTIEPGADFRRTIATEVSSCDLLIALIGQKWLALDQRTGQPRLHNDDDFVAVEIKTALDRGIYVIPVLVDEARMPTAAELPTSLRLLATRNAARLDHETFHSDIRNLLSALERILRTVAAERTARHQQHTARGQFPTQGPEPAHASPNPGPTPHQRSSGPTAGGAIGAPEPITDRRDEPAEISRRPVPVVRVAMRIVLWWIVYPFSMFTATGVLMTITGRADGPVYGGIVGCLILLGALGGLAALLRREIRIQRRMLRQFGPDGERRLSESNLSVKHVRKVAIICAAVAVGFGSAIALTPPSTPSDPGTITAP